MFEAISKFLFPPKPIPVGVAQAPTVVLGAGSLSAVLSAIKDGIVVVDASKHVLLVNKTAEGIAALTTKEMIGKPILLGLQFFFNDEDITARIFSEISNSWDVKAKLLLANNKETFMKITTTPIVENNVISGWVLAMHDVRFEKQLEEMKFGFVSIAAHELRTPLTSIKGSVSVIFSDYKDSLNEDQKNLLGQIASNTERLLILVENLLNVSRIERGAVEFAPTQIDWIDTAGQVIEDFKQRATEKNITLAFVPPPEKISLIKADKVRIIEVLSNLLANAINYTFPSGKVTVAIENKGSEVWTSVSDTGRGIPKDAIPHLFTKFFRVSQGLTSDQNSHGTGLGLYISKAIVDMHKGKIWVNSQEGKGSTFTFTLPL